MKNQNTDYKKLAKHFKKDNQSLKSATEAMRLLYRKWQSTKTGLWIIYVKAYNYDLTKNKG